MSLLYCGFCAVWMHTIFSTANNLLLINTHLGVYKNDNKSVLQKTNIHTKFVM